MNKIQWIDFFREIKKSRGRYLSLLFIVALGTAFYAGIRSSEPDMTLSADTYYDDTNFMDIRILSTMGMTEDDLSEIKKIPGIEKAELSQNGEYFSLVENAEPVISLVSLGRDLNQFTVMEGRLPERPDEIFVDAKYKGRAGIGDQVTLIDGDKETPEDLTINTFTVCGYGTWSWYLNLTRGTASIGDGSVDAFMVVLPEVFDRDYYSVVYASVEGAREENCYRDAYDDLIEPVKEKIKDIRDVRCEIRYDAVYAEAKEKLDDAKEEIADAKKELSDAKKKLDDGEKEYQDGLKNYQDGKKKYEDGLVKYEDGLKSYQDGKKKYEDGLVTYEDGLKAYEDGKKKLSDARKELDDGWKQYNEGKKAYDEGKAEFDTAKKTIEDGEAALSEGKKTLEASEKELADQKALLDEKSKELSDGEAAIAEGFAAIEAGKKDIEVGKTELAANKVAYEEGLKAYEAGYKEYSENKAQYEMNKPYLSEEQRKESEAQLAEAEATLAETKATLDQASKELAAGEAALAAGEKELADQEALLLEKQKEVKAGKKAVKEGYATIASYEKEFAAGKKELKAKEKELKAGKKELTASEETLKASRKELKAAKKKLEDGEKSYSDGMAELEASEKKLADGKKELDDAKKELISGEKELKDAQKELDDAKKELISGEKELKDARKELDDGWKEYKDAKKEADEKIADAEEEIADGEEKLNDLSVPDWYVLGRDTIQSGVEYGMDAERIGNIGKVFPVIFFLVAALVCLTTMTRMIEEERMLIGTMKALGYGKLAIASKYIFYAFSATLAGGILGVLAGSKILPYVIMSAYGMLYTNVPYKLMPYDTAHCLTAIGLALLCTVGAAFAACYKELLSEPAALMRPPAPKRGRKIFLERMPFIWNHLNFSFKSTIRNLLRYKKRFFMTVIGIGGCMSILLVSYGLHDAIAAIVDNQYKNIWTYSVSVGLEEKDSLEEKETLMEKILSEKPELSKAMLARNISTDVSNENGSKSVYLYVVEGIEQMEGLLSLHDRESGQEYLLSDDGIIVSEKLARMLKLAPGDLLTVKTGDTSYKEVTVLASAENYLNNYIYMTPALYKEVYGEEAAFNEMFIKYDKAFTEDEENALSQYLLTKEGVTSVSLASRLQANVNDMMNALNLVVWVLVIAAGLLVFVVTFNLNNINISERRRELASLKVLGFYDMEVAMYVYRENIFLTFFGILAGLFLGTWLDQYVIRTLEVEMIMFGRDISSYSYMMSSLLTIVFSIIVNAVMYYKLRQIDMVESLKSVE